MILYIDTTDFSKVAFWLNTGKIKKKTYKIDPKESHRTLLKLEEFLKSASIKPEMIKKIVVNKGPGSFTGVRIGVVLAQALGFAWKVPIVALKKEDFNSKRS